MGRYNLRATRVHSVAAQLLETGRITTPPPWFDVLHDIPTSEILIRPLQRTETAKPLKPNQNVKKMSKMFQPVPLSYEEDTLRTEFFKDHPWELARPRVLLEGDGNDSKRYDWSRIQQMGKKLDGESVVQRQRWLMKNEALDHHQAYDKARKEFYRIRNKEEIRVRIAREEARQVGAYFNKGPLEIGMELENTVYEHWKVWALKEIELKKQAQAAMYTGVTVEAAELDDGQLEGALEEVEDSIPADKDGIEAKGGVALHP